VVLETLWLILLGGGRGLELHIGIADAEDIGGHYGLCMVCMVCMVCMMFDRFLRVDV
jgi:hypothetical protein